MLASAIVKRKTAPKRATNAPRAPETLSTDDQNAFATITFSECVENHAGMQMIGERRARGISDALLEDCTHCSSKLVPLEMEGSIRVPPNMPLANVLVIPDGVDKLLGPGAKDAMYAEMLEQPYDRQFLHARRKIVMNKHGRFNNCYADEAQKPDIPAGKGTVVAFGDAPLVGKLRDALPTLFKTDAVSKEVTALNAETNLYYDVSNKKVGIGWHGDTERRIVVGVRLGNASERCPLRFKWYNQCTPVSDEIEIPLKHGDIYVMGEKATGYDWMTKWKMTLRHGVGLKAC